MSKKTNEFREWLSDNLRYFMLAFIVILIIAVAVLSITLYSKMSGDGGKKEPETVTTEESASETEKPTEKQTERQTEPQTQTQSEKQTEPKTEAQTEEPQTQAPTEPAPEPETIPETEPQTEPQLQTEPQPVYLTMQGSCYLRAEPSMEAEIIGEYWTGTTVEFLEDVGGWYKVRVDGMVGYMGARFF